MRRESARARRAASDARRARRPRAIKEYPCGKLGARCLPIHSLTEGGDGDGFAQCSQDPHSCIRHPGASQASLRRSPFTL